MRVIHLTLALAAAMFLTSVAAAQDQMQPIPMGQGQYDGYEDVDSGYGGAPGYYGGYYYHTSWGSPVAQLVPPTAGMHISYSRTVGGTTVNPIYSQYRGPMYGAEVYGGEAPGMYGPTPYWPTSTSQFGVYYIRAPW